MTDARSYRDQRQAENIMGCISIRILVLFLYLYELLRNTTLITTRIYFSLSLFLILSVLNFLNLTFTFKISMQLQQSFPKANCRLSCIIRLSQSYILKTANKVFFTPNKCF